MLGGRGEGVFKPPLIYYSLYKYVRKIITLLMLYIYTHTEPEHKKTLQKMEIKVAKFVTLLQNIFFLPKLFGLLTCTCNLCVIQSSALIAH